MLISTWIDRFATYNRGNTHVRQMKLPHTIEFHKHNGRKGLRRFESDDALQDFISNFKADWKWYQCSMDNMLVSNY